MSSYMQQVVAEAGMRYGYTERDVLKAVEAPLMELKAAPVEDRLAFVFEALERLPRATTTSLALALRGMVSKLLNAGGLPLTGLDAVRLVQAVTQHKQMFPLKAVLSALEGLTMTPALRDALLALRATIDQWYGSREMQDLHNRIDELVSGTVKEKPAGAVGSWSRRVFQEIDQSPQQLAWRALFLHARSLTQSTASRKWQSEAVAHVDRIGRAEFLAAARRFLAFGPIPDVPHPQQVPDEEADYQKGFIWTLGALGDASIAADIVDFAFACFRKIPQIGAVSHKAGNACVNALAVMPGLDAVTQISRLAMRVKYDVARRLIEKALVEAAARNNVSRDDLEAMSVPSYGLDAQGVRVEMLGDCQATLSVSGGAAHLSFASSEGNPLKTVPAAVKAGHAETLAELKKAAKELDAVLSTQRLRMERLLLSESKCPLESWKAWYLDHPVTQGFARRLIWEIETNGETQTAIWHDGSLVDWAGNVVATAPESMVRLWHPIRASVQTVLSWRCFLEDHGVQQPFKQAHREVYLLTDAERQTETYSNRFAAHIVRQHQFSALCRERGWQFNLMGQWDSHNNPYLDLPQYNLRVEFDVDFPDEQEGQAPLSGHAIYLTIKTGRVRFHAAGKPAAAGPLRLADVPVTVFSEVMRDVDLLIGVTSIGADPTWGVERGNAHAEYWNRFADGDLTASAENRKEILAALLPKLAIRDRCTLSGRYLVVRGDWHEYRIHLGSGNVMMEPGSRYLCIVRGAGDSASSFFLPFEGDLTLTVILSKAFLLANEKAIKDEAILQQIR